MGLDLPSCFSNKLWLTAISWLFLWLCLKINYPQFQRIISISPLRGYYMVILEYTPFSDTRIHSNSFCMLSDRSRAWFSSVSESGVALQKIWRTYVELFESLHLHWGLPPGNSTSAWKSVFYSSETQSIVWWIFRIFFDFSGEYPLSDFRIIRDDAGYLLTSISLQDISTNWWGDCMIHDVY